MSKGRKTKPITFNLFDRGRKHTGQDRGNVDKRAWIDLINSPATQEMINTGGMFGYYGHQLRMLYGTYPPETVVVQGKTLSISPALRTIEMHCDELGNVTHRQEFLETPEGDFAMEKYKAKIGGFSQAASSKLVDSVIVPIECGGMDYVLQPNYIHNIGDGILLDGATISDYQRNTLELSTLELYDSIHQFTNQKSISDANLMRAIAAENQLLEEKIKKERREALIAQKHNNILDSALCPTLSLDEYLKPHQGFMGDSVILDLEPKHEDAEEKYKVRHGVFGWL